MLANLTEIILANFTTNLPGVAIATIENCLPILKVTKEIHDVFDRSGLHLRLLPTNISSPRVCNKSSHQVKKNRQKFKETKKKFHKILPSKLLIVDT